MAGNECDGQTIFKIKKKNKKGTKKLIRKGIQFFDVKNQQFIGTGN